ncbi:hypothetical protein K2173_003508 [Erythroxylum novogranatense]|uniref:FAD dependent oxidoreductase domain-containing protein n=1 Tax=Erythroxylum novogranatense TaxID=1862640 RepID=A0AAV8TBK4_9ROSI|nr:hypothetical protein K2173_003508 [Erythroxylum novogranatense]
MEYSCGEEFDVIVVGAGIMGSSTAYQLAKRGQNTLLLEQFDFLHHCGSSHGESRTLRATYRQDYYGTMVLESSQLWEKAENEIGFKVYFKGHHFDMGPVDDRSLSAIISSCGKNSIPYRVLNHREVAEQFSGRIDIPDNWIGVRTELGGIIKPTKAVSMFQTLAIQNGAVLRDHMEVKNIVKDKDKGGIWVFTVNGEKFWAKKCVVTAGAWTSRLIKKFSGIELPIEPLETMVCYWRIKEGKEKEFTLGGGFPTFASYGEPRVYGTPAFEFPGLIKIAVHGGQLCDPDNRPWGPGVSLSLVKEWIGRTLMGQVDCERPVATQLCMYSVTPDEDFVIDFVGGEFGKDVVVGGGFSGHGFKMGPVVGRILADLALEGEAKGVELKHFGIRRFEDSPGGNVKDFGDELGNLKLN